MNKLTVFTIALTAAGLAQAQAQETAPAKTRAEVIAELQQARESGELAAMHAEIGVNGYLGNVPGTAMQGAVARKPAGKTRHTSGEIAALQTGK